jgi:hypothetical protein
MKVIVNKLNKNNKNKNIWKMCKGINEYEKKDSGKVVADTTSSLPQKHI